MAVRAVFLDFGGTLAEPLTDAYPVYDSVLRPLGRSVPREEWAAAERRAFDRMLPLRYAPRQHGLAWEDRVAREVLERLGIPDPHGKVVEGLHAAFTSATFHRPYDDAEPAVRALRASGLHVQVVSNNTDYLLETIDRLGWAPLFDRVTFSQEAGAEKPDRRVFELALQRAGCEPVEAVHVGDSWEADYQGAARVGLASVWLNRAGRTPPEPCDQVRDLRAFARRHAR